MIVNQKVLPNVYNKCIEEALKSLRNTFGNTKHEYNTMIYNVAFECFAKIDHEISFGGILTSYYTNSLEFESRLCNETDIPIGAINMFKNLFLVAFYTIDGFSKFYSDFVRQYKLYKGN